MIDIENHSATAGSTQSGRFLWFDQDGEVSAVGEPNHDVAEGATSIHNIAAALN